jgi:phosphopantetheinyl transferase
VLRNAPFLVGIIDITRLGFDELQNLAWPFFSEEKRAYVRSHGELVSTRLSVGCRALLKLMLEANGNESHIFSLVTNPEYGFHTLVAEGVKPCSVSFAHSETLGCCAIGCKPIGVDIERRDRVAEGVMQRVCTDRELGFANQTKTIGGHEVRNALLLWTAKEAASKAMGLGFRGGFRNIEIDLMSEPLVRVLSKVEGPIATSGLVVSFQVYQDYLLAVCHEHIPTETHGLLIYPQTC